MKRKPQPGSHLLPASFKNVESFKHALAKELLYAWLKSSERYKRQGHCCKFGDISWRKSAGIHQELPFYDNSSPYYFEFPPKRPGKILFIPDIVVFSQGHAHLIFEIVHKSDISEAKGAKMEAFFKDCYVEVHRISADYILNQVAQPKRLKTTIYKIAA